MAEVFNLGGCIIDRIRLSIRNREVLIYKYEEYSNG